MTPSVSRIVHYVSRGSADGMFQPECRAAIIAEVGAVQEECALVVFNPNGLYFNFCAHDEDEKKGGTWHWPERVE
jgi:hypothetical protein